ncbi:hypothetical protein ACGF13_14710 [Kitasatospora sp. NPDC048286]|uniref:hypothetical protein n=1 Tax=unclassified Kitasatospora TaxID=2633591 RepID=UPI0037132AC3
MMYDERDEAARHLLEGWSIMGKLRPLWSQRVLGIAHEYRVGVPPGEGRMVAFRRKPG